MADARSRVLLFFPALFCETELFKERKKSKTCSKESIVLVS